MSSQPGAALRAQAARLLKAVLADGRSLKAVLAQALPSISDSRDRALLEAMCFGALRHRRRYEFALSQWLPRPLPKKEYAVHCLLLAGLSQLDALQLPAHAAVAATTEACRVLGRPQMVGLVNALLRRATREALPESDDISIRHSHPEWLVTALQNDWPDHWQHIVAANNEIAPMWLRCHRRRAPREQMLARLAAQGLTAIAPDFPPHALRLETAVAAETLPGWQAGALLVQDGAAQLAVEALAPRAGERLLDACAAPGGKTAQIAEVLGDGELMALDIDAARLRRIEKTLDRLGLVTENVQLRAADAATTKRWWDGRLFDAILLDAPCSATGIIRRQPDIKWHRRSSDIPALVASQARLLDALWPTLRPGGRLLYATCSVLDTENAAQIIAFLERHSDAHVLPLDARYGHARGPGRQRLPGDDGMDGFFYALIGKCSEATE